MQNDGGESLAKRKAEHLAICLDEQRYVVEGGRCRYDEISFIHRALPELALPEVSASTEFFGLPVAAPLFISSMTGGSAEGYRMNRDLARVAEALGIAVGMGSIRILFRKPDVLPQFQLKKLAPTVPVFANIGGVQIRSMDHGEIFSMLDRLGVDGIAVHLNPGQELFQDDGDRDFRGILDSVGTFCRNSPVPVMVKETGFGINPAETKRLLDRGARYVNLAGAGGTNWITVEAYRDAPAGVNATVGGEFADWGTPTALLQCALGRNLRGIVASGGIRSGMDVAKAVALGAEAVGTALPFVRAVAREGVDGGVRFGSTLVTTVERVMALTGCRTVADLRRVPLIVGRELQHDSEMLRKASEEM